MIEAFGLTIDSQSAKNTFFEINQSLKKKYSLVYKKTPSVGDLLVKYKRNDVNIILNTPRLKNETFLTYATENILQIESNYLKQQENSFNPDINEIL